MKSFAPRFQGLLGAITALACMPQLPALAVNVIQFSPSAAGLSKSVPTWGVDTAWPNYDNVRRSIESIGLNNVDVVRVAFYANEPLAYLGRGEYALSNNAKALVDAHLALAALAGSNKPLTLVPSGTDPGSIDPSYVSGSGMNTANYALMIKKTQEYINSKPGFASSPIMAIEAFNEPDFNFPNANTADLNSIIQQLKTYSVFQNTQMMAGSTLNSDFAQGWYDSVPEATAGSSHLLAGSLTSWTNFIDHVNGAGKPFINPEIHSMGEILAGAEHGMSLGMVWADVLLGRGTLIQASDGQRLGYAQDLTHQSAGAVYRAPNGTLYAFAGGLERNYTGSPSAYRFISDQDVYFNGIRVKEFMLQTKPDDFASAMDNDFVNFGSASSEGAFAQIDLNSSGVPALDGYRWKIVNALDGTVMEVAGSGTSNGANIRSATDNGGLNQLWQITRTRNGYYHLYNSNSGLTAEVAGFSLANGANVQQWGSAEDSNKQWYLEPASNGAFYLKNAFTNKVLDADLGSTNIFQWEGNGGLNQRWYFVPTNPTRGPKAQYMLHGNANDAGGLYNGTALGGPNYVAGPTGAANTAMSFDGVNDYVSLPAGVGNSADITVSAWVNWNGGAAWQRIFDFGDDTNTYMFLTPSSGDNLMHFGITTASYQSEQVLETAPLPSNQWVHVALTLGGNTGILYINGEPQVAGQILLDPSDISPTFHYIGKSLWSNDPLFRGAISDFQIFDYALDQSQIAELVNAADANHDGKTDGTDLLLLQRTNPSLIPLWQQQYGQGTSQLAAAGAVPEPSAYALGGIVLVASIASHLLWSRRQLG